MTTAESCGVYEQALWRDIGGEVLHPGGPALTEHTLALCKLPAGARLLDFGCGAGATVQYAIDTLHLAAVGVDLSVALLQRGRDHRPGLPLLRATGTRLPFVTASIDAILAECSLSVIAERDGVLADMWRVLKHNGVLALSDVYARDAAGAATLQTLPIASGLRGALSQAQIVDQLQAHGFCIEAWEDHAAALKQFAAQAIFACGSMDEFWRTTGGDPFAITLAIARARPSYFVLLARKGTVDDCRL